MPTVLWIGPYRFFFYSRGNQEPPHIHVERDENVAKIYGSESVGLVKGTASQAAEKLGTVILTRRVRISVVVTRSSSGLHRLPKKTVLLKGTASAVPQNRLNIKRALAPEVG